jgi:SAM-dependent methyltransferase
MSKVTHWLDNKFYPNFQNNWDDRLFRERILSRINENYQILDLGAGAGNELMNFRGLVKHDCGVDPNGRVLDNPYLDEARVGFGEKIPYDDESFDLVFSSNVLEHLEKPEEVFKEVSRVLKPGGIFLAKTPNAWHYVPMIGRLLPHFLHEFLIINFKRSRLAHDIFPTFYRVNTADRIKYYSELAGMRCQQVSLIEGRPEYLRFNSLTYLIGTIYEYIVNHIKLFANFRVVIVAEIAKIK